MQHHLAGFFHGRGTHRGSLTDLENVQRRRHTHQTHRAIALALQLWLILTVMVSVVEFPLNTWAPNWFRAMGFSIGITFLHS